MSRSRRSVRARKRQSYCSPSSWRAFARRPDRATAGSSIELLHRHQLDRGDAELAEIRDLVDHAEESPLVAAIGRRVDRQPADMGLVDDGLRPRGPRPGRSLPIEASVDQQTAPGGWPCGGLGIVQVERDRNRKRIRVEQQRIAVEPMPLFRRPRSVHAVGIGLAPSYPFHEGVPDVARSMANRIQIEGPQRLRACHVREDQEL